MLFIFAHDQMGSSPNEWNESNTTFGINVFIFIFAHSWSDLNEPLPSQGSKRWKKNTSNFCFANYFWHDERLLMWNMTPFSNSTAPPAHTHTHTHALVAADKWIFSGSWHRYNDDARQRRIIIMHSFAKCLINTIDAIIGRSTCAAWSGLFWFFRIKRN